MTDGIRDASFFSFSGYEDYERIILGIPELTDLPAEVLSIGKSVRGRIIYCLRIGEDSPAKRGVLYLSIVHSMEFIGGDLSLAIIRWFLDKKNKEESLRIIARCNAYFIPVVNPDGYQRAVDKRGKPGIFFVRKNAAGVDLNRNFPVGFSRIGFNPAVSSGLRFMPVYRGPMPFSEPETRAIKNFVESISLRASISFHSPGRYIGYPYCYKKSRCPDRDELHRLAMAMRAQQPYFKYRAGQEYNYYPTTGDLDDWLYEEFGVFAFIMEIGRVGFRFNDPSTWLSPFAWCNPPDVEREIENNLPAALYLARWAAGIG
ncbi:MAG: M14 family zinc carboxypeptidase [bacterium]